MKSKVQENIFIIVTRFGVWHVWHVFTVRLIMGDMHEVYYFLRGHP